MKKTILFDGNYPVLLIGEDSNQRAILMSLVNPDHPIDAITSKIVSITKDGQKYYIIETQNTIYKNSLHDTRNN